MYVLFQIWEHYLNADNTKFIASPCPFVKLHCTPQAFFFLNFLKLETQCYYRPVLYQLSYWRTHETQCYFKFTSQSTLALNSHPAVWGSILNVIVHLLNEERTSSCLLAWHRVSFCSSGCHENHSVAPIGLQFVANLLVSASQEIPCLATQNFGNLSSKPKGHFGWMVSSEWTF